MSASLILFDDRNREQLLPFTFTRPACDIRCGILTIREKWEKHLARKSTSYTVPYLQKKFATNIETDNLWINGRIFPDEGLVKTILHLNLNESLTNEGDLIAARLDRSISENFSEELIGKNTKSINYLSSVLKIGHVWDIFQKNGEAIERDFDLLTAGRLSVPLSSSNHSVNHDRIFIEAGARVEAASLNASKGSIYIGANAEVMEGSLIRGPFAALENSKIKMGAKIYGPTTIGPYCKVGGEINNSILFGYSNKAHDGFLGNSVLGEWCNLGADSNNSNLKNDYAEVKLWNYSTKKFENTGTSFCGLMMGDHSKCGINTMFNTGTVVGVFANIFGAGYPRNLVSSFSWGGPAGMTEYNLEKAFAVAERVLARREMKLEETDKDILKAIFEMKDR